MADAYAVVGGGPHLAMSSRKHVAARLRFGLDHAPVSQASVDANKRKLEAGVAAYGAAVDILEAVGHVRSTLIDVVACGLARPVGDDRNTAAQAARDRMAPRTQRDLDHRAALYRSATDLDTRLPTVITDLRDALAQEVDLQAGLLIGHLNDPLGPVTRAAKRNLVATSAVAIFISLATGTLGSEVEVLGMKFTAANRGWLIGALAAATVYFLVSAHAYRASDKIAWRKAGEEAEHYWRNVDKLIGDLRSDVEATPEPFPQRADILSWCREGDAKVKLTARHSRSAPSEGMWTFPSRR